MNSSLRILALPLLWFFSCAAPLRAATDLTFTIEASPDLTPLSWVPAIIDSNTATQLIARDSVKTSGSARRFIRLRVTQP